MSSYITFSSAYARLRLVSDPNSELMKIEVTSPPSQSQEPSSINTNLYYVAHTYVGTVRQEEQKVLTFRISQGYGIWLTTVPSCTDPLHM